MSYARVRLSILGPLVAMVLAPRPGAGQTCSAAVPAGSCTASTTTTMTAGTVLQLAVSASATTLAPPTTAGYDAGFVADNGPAATVKCNRSWTLKIAAGAAFWTASNTTPGVTARANKPASDLQWSSAPAGPFAGITVAGATFTSGAATAGTAASLYYHTLYSWTLDTPGAYSLVVVLTLSAP